MKLVIQRVKKAKVSVNEKTVGKIERGLFILLGVREGDTLESAGRLADKLVKLRIMSDDKDKMNLSVKEVGGEILVVSQFTLYADTMNGNRPSFIKAANPTLAEKIYNHFIDRLKSNDIKIETGEFGKYMIIEPVLDGPVTILLEE
ncbi:D-tyrosyl-tRNA(Tyr) deacylase [Candidatus Woesebacteria bacterium RIFCSPLOWO2_01_FULL_37_19]|uniref:D-aminoacyl-tRNA deacylase n=2 Tax=Candidatus Woeseibacteriota TaxID=1752722 RepID=A0A1F8BC75_9BACT|nr:MAG: D-tyrosyl-tRNA(Tyr) deacylase [Candidatus Woesebacteria bacterium RIFCSPHIGHO2_01_FULL_38_26b]OGM60938.1 MAG: D-tyrosyl-tRNA(Tyr) deacylase [Candidatus Woesebacteria bacterium RIFCSPLOWO2_01_FULL_37_19]